MIKHIKQFKSFTDLCYPRFMIRLFLLFHWTTVFWNAFHCPGLRSGVFPYRRIARPLYVRNVNKVLILIFGNTAVLTRVLRILMRSCKTIQINRRHTVTNRTYFVTLFIYFSSFSSPAGWKVLVLFSNVVSSFFKIQFKIEHSFSNSRHWCRWKRFVFLTNWWKWCFHFQFCVASNRLLH